MPGSKLSMTEKNPHPNAPLARAQTAKREMVEQHGTQNQIERHYAGLLPEDELLALARTALFAPSSPSGASRRSFPTPSGTSPARAVRSRSSSSPARRRMASRGTSGRITAAFRTRSRTPGERCRRASSRRSRSSSTSGSAATAGARRPSVELRPFASSGRDTSSFASTN